MVDRGHSLERSEVFVRPLSVRRQRSTSREADEAWTGEEN